jgi:hypothetical protein
MVTREVAYGADRRLPLSPSFAPITAVGIHPDSDKQEVAIAAIKAEAKRTDLAACQQCIRYTLSSTVPQPSLFISSKTCLDWILVSLAIQASGHMLKFVTKLPSSYDSRFAHFQGGLAECAASLV